MVSCRLVPWVAAGAAVALGGCALVLGFEEHEPFPSSVGGQGAVGGSGATGGSGLGGSGTGQGGGAGTGQGGTGGTGVDVLLVPDISTDAVGMYAPDDGTYLGDFLPPLTGGEPYEFVTPHSAVQGPDGRIYVSDQITDAIVRFETDGTFAGVFADATDGLDNVRGLDFRDDELFASVSPNAGPPFVARFDLAGNRLANFVEDGGDPFDILFLPNRTMMFANLTDPDDVRLYDITGLSSNQLLTVDFPAQLQPLPGGTFVVAGWSEVTEFRLDGSVVRTLLGVSSCSGVYPLDDGDWLVTSDDGVRSYDPATMSLVEAVRVGGSFMKVERVTLPILPTSALGRQLTEHDSATTSLPPFAG